MWNCSQNYNMFSYWLRKLGQYEVIKDKAKQIDC